MNITLLELGLEIPSLAEVLRLIIQLTLAAVIGGMLGYEREQAGKEAGIRTHILVSLGAAFFVLAVKQAGASDGETTRVIQGVATGVGFIGGGAILKLSDRERILGLTTAATIWLTAALGVTVALGHLWLPLLGTAYGLFVLIFVNRFTASPEKSAIHETTTTK